MNILFISHYYPPEIGAASNRIGFFARFLAAHGHAVTVLAPSPSYPDAKIYVGHENRLTIVSEEGVNVIRTRVFLSAKKSLSGRLAHYFSFIINGFFARRRIEKPDVIFATSPPLFVGLLAVALKKRWSVPLVVDIRDLWPQSVESVSLIGSRPLLRAGSRLAHFLYRSADHLTVTSKGIARQLQQYTDKLSVMPNGADLELFAHHLLPHPIIGALPLKEKFVVMYTGNLGLAQAPEVLISAAETLRNKEDIVFVIAGSGVLLDDLKRMAQRAALTNVIFTGPLPRSAMPSLLARANVCIIPYKKADTFRNTLPSKLFDYMAAAKPVIINLEGEAWDIIQEAGCGVLAREEDSRSLGEQILSLRGEGVKLPAIGEKGRQFVGDNFNRASISAKLEQLLGRVGEAGLDK